jgi:hypothetical protein
MTDPTGKSFLSYRRDRLSDGRKILAAQHDLGIPTWQDLNDLEEGHTDGLLRSVLAQPEIANAVAYLTPEVATSATITRTELPGIVQRVDTNDGFFMVPVAGGGLGYDKVAAVAGSYLGTHDLGNWNVTKVSSDPLTDADASLIARRVLKQRLIAIHSSLASDLALKVGLYTRGTPAFSSGTALAIDWMHRFAGRLAVDQAWEDHLLPALRTVHEKVARYAPGRAIEFSGLCALPAAVALGTSFMATSGLSTSWLQSSPKHGVQRWSLDTARAPSRFAARTRAATTHADDLAVLVSVASNAEPAFGASRSDLPEFRATIHISRPDEGYPQDVATPGEAADITALVVESLRAARDTYQARGVVHLFLAGPVGLAFLIGQSLNTAGPVQTYEHIPTDAVGRYQASVFLRPLH